MIINLIYGAKKGKNRAKTAKNRDKMRVKKIIFAPFSHHFLKIYKKIAF